jgi:putative addiction module component (TIGR02574 family)
MNAPATLDVTQVLQEALALPLAERSYLAERLLVSLDDDGELSPAWREELDARVQCRQRGETRSLTREEVSEHIETILA